MKLGLAGASALVLMMAAGPVLAAEVDADGVADVSQVVVTGSSATRAVTSTKTDTPLIEVPQSVTVIGSEELERRNVQSISQALTYVAGVGPNQRGNVAVRYDQLTIRGFSPGVFLDGMRLLGGTYSSPQIDFHRVEQVDIIKGPASVLYGNATPGGLINLTSKEPLADRHGQIDVAAGTQALLRANADVGGPIDADGRFLFRIIGGAEKSDGFVNYTKNERYHVSPMISFVPSDATKLTVIASYQRDPKGGSYGSVPPIGTAVDNPLVRLPVDFYDGEPTYEAFDRKQKMLTGKLNHAFSDAISYRAAARKVWVKQHYRSVYSSSLMPDLRTMIRGGGGSDEDFSATTFDNSVTANFATGPLAHELLLGLDYQRVSGRGYQRFVTGAANGIPNLDLLNPVYGVTIFDVLAGQPATDLKRKQTGVYLQDQIKLGGLNIIGSIRKDWYKQTTTTAGVASVVDQDKVTYRIGALYAFDFGLSPYVSYSTSFEPQGGVNLAGIPYVPIVGRQYEAGLKYQPPGTQTILTASVYDLARQNVLVTDPANPRNSIQVGEVSTKGVELEGRGQIRPGLDFNVAATYMDTKFVRGNPPSTTVVNGAVQSGVTGTRPLAVPKWTLSSYLSYELGEAGVGGWLSGFTLGGGVRYVGGSDGTYSLVTGTVTTATRFRTDGYTLVDALIGYDLGKLSPGMEGMNLAVNVNNLFDTRHVTSCLSNNWCWYGAQRTVAATLRYKW